VSEKEKTREANDRSIDRSIALLLRRKMKIISPLFSLSHTPKEGPGLLESSSYKKRRITFSRSFGLFFGRARALMRAGSK
jgi:hypothetical protein